MPDEIFNPDDQRGKVVRCLTDYLDEAEEIEKRPRRDKNQRNWRMFYGDIDWGNVPKGHVRLHLPRFSTASEDIRSGLKQRLASFDKWLEVDDALPSKEKVLTKMAARWLLRKYLGKNDFMVALSDSLLLGGIETRATLRRIWDQKKGLRWEPRDFESYIEDVESGDLYKFEWFYLDYWRVKRLSAKEPTKKRPYHEFAVEMLKGGKDQGDEEDEAKKEPEGQPEKGTLSERRKQVKIHNFWGTILDLETGEPMVWKKEGGEEFKLEDVFCTVGNSMELLSDPVPIKDVEPDELDPFVSALLLRSPGPGNKAILDPMADMNEAEDNLFSMALTGAIKKVHQITLVHEKYIKNKEMLSGGIEDGSTLTATHNAPTDLSKIIHSIKTGEFPAETQAMLNILSRVAPESVMSNQLDSGVLPSKEVRVGEANLAAQSIAGIRESMAQDVEDTLIQSMAEKSLSMIVAHSKEIPKDEIFAAFGDADREKAEQWLAMSASKRLQEIKEAFTFKGKGLRGQAMSAQKAQSLINLLSVMVAQPAMQELISSVYSIPKFVKDIFEGFNLDEENYKLSEQEQEQRRRLQELQVAALELAKGQGQSISQGNGSANPSAQNAPEGGARGGLSSKPL